MSRWWLALAVLMLPRAVAAYPTSTNLTPSAEVLSEGEKRYEVSFNSYGGLFRSGTERYLFSQFGWRNLEWGVDFYRYPDDDGNYRTRWAFNAKLRLWEETQRRPALAVGILDVGAGLKASPYAVLGKSVGRSVWHLGAGRFDDAERWWLAWEYELSPRWLLVVDRLSGRDGHSCVGLYWQFTRQLELGVVVGFPHRGDNDRLFILNLAWMP